VSEYGELPSGETDMMIVPPPSECSEYWTALEPPVSLFGAFQRELVPLGPPPSRKPCSRAKKPATCTSGGSRPGNVTPNSASPSVEAEPWALAKTIFVETEGLGVPPSRGVFARGDAVDYFSLSEHVWIPTCVMTYDASLDVYDTAIRQCVPRNRLRASL